MTPHLRDDSLSQRHGFFGRQGGVSEGQYESLNTGLGSDDVPEHVLENRRRVCKALGAEHVQTCHQIHSAKALFVDAPFDGRPQGDGLVTRTPGLALGALHADCAPVLLEADGMVAACHAGWRGALAGITEATVALMREHGADHIRAVIGPCISVESYEVGDEFRETFVRDDPSSAAFFAKSSDAIPNRRRDWVGSDWHFDLSRYVAARLERSGVTATRLDVCTYAEPARYFSHRYNTHQGLGDYGRNISAIVLTP